VKSRRPVGAAIVAVIVVRVTVAIAAGDGQEHRGDTRERAAMVASGPDDVVPTTEGPTTTAKPLSVALAPCAVLGSADPYLVVCGPAAAKTGDRTTFDLVARGHIRDDCGSPTVDWGDRTGNVVCTMTCDAYPADERSMERKLDHVYSDPGVYTLRFVLQGCGPDHRPQAEITMEVQVG
jgi:hypothetical protein